MPTNQFLKIYPSGFLGSATVAQTNPIDMNALSKQLVSTGLVQKTSQYTANIEVVEMRLKMNSGDKEIKTFDFYENVLKIAIRAFGSNRIVDWIDAQASSAEFGDRHMQFIDETIRFVLGGHARSVSASTWASFLTVGDNRLTSRTRSKIVDAYFYDRTVEGEFFNNPNSELFYSYNRQQHTMTIRDFIGLWVSREGGIYDLQNSLHVFFGERK